MWSCHTLWNELLGTASVSLGSLLKSGRRRTYEPDPAGPSAPAWPGCARGEWRWPQRLPGPGKGTRCRCVLGRGVTGAVPLLARALLPARKHKPLSYVLPFVVARVWLVMAATA